MCSNSYGHYQNKPPYLKAHVARVDITSHIRMHGYLQLLEFIILYWRWERLMTKLHTFRVAFRATSRLCKSSFVDGHKARHLSNSSTVAGGISGVP